MKTNTISVDEERQPDVTAEKQRVLVKIDELTGTPKSTEKIEDPEKTIGDLVTTGSNEVQNGDPVPGSSTKLTGVRLYVVGFALAIGNVMMALDASILGMLLKIRNPNSGNRGRRY